MKKTFWKSDYNVLVTIGNEVIRFASVDTLSCPIAVLLETRNSLVHNEIVMDEDHHGEDYTINIFCRGELIIEFTCRSLYTAMEVYQEKRKAYYNKIWIEFFGE